MGISILHIYMCVWTISKDSDINKEKEICLPNKKSVSVHRCERITMVVKCEMFINSSKNVIGISIKLIWLPNMEYWGDHRCKGTNMAYKNIWDCQLNTSWALVFSMYTFLQIFKRYWHKKENKICLPTKESISGQIYERITMVAKCEMFMNSSKNFIGISIK